MDPIVQSQFPSEIQISFFVSFNSVATLFIQLDPWLLSLTYVNDMIIIICFIHSFIWFQDVLLPLHHRSLQIVPSRAEPNPSFLLRPSHSTSAWHKWVTRFGIVQF